MSSFTTTRRCIGVVGAIILGLFGSVTSIGAYAQESETVQQAYDAAYRMGRTVDEKIREKLHASGGEGVGTVSDSVFLRRACLDLTGVNPDASIARKFLDDSDPSKRMKMLRSIIESPGFAVRLADYWAELLVADSTDAGLMLQRESLRRWLVDRFADDVRYDRVVADLLVSSGDPSEQPTAFFSALEVKPEKLAERTCRIFLGVTLDCAQCHDHPFDRWKQSDFWGVAAYFARVQSQARSGSPSMLNQRIYDVDEGEVQIPETSTVVQPKPLLEGVESGLGIGSRRQQLAIWVTSKQNRWFAKAAVNRMWAMLMGVGLIEPVDDMSGKNLPSYPELLEDLATFFQTSGYSMRQLAMAIASSEAYASPSLGSGKSWGEVPFSHMISKPLTARQLAGCLRQIARDQQMPRGSERLQGDLWNQLASQLGTIRGEGSEYSGGVLQSLLIQNSTSTEQLWVESTSRLLKALHSPHLTPKDQFEWMFLATLGRLPTDIEHQRLWVPLSSEWSMEGMGAVQGDLLWALINSTEFAMTP